MNTRRRSAAAATAFTAVLSLASVSWFLTNLGAQRGPEWLGWLPTVPAAVISVLVCLRVAGTRSLPAPVRSFWYAMAVAALFTGVGVAFQAVAASTGPGQPVGPVTIICYGMVGVVVTWSLMRFPSLPLRHRSAREPWLEALTAMLGAGLVTWYLVGDPVLRGGHSAGSIVLAALAMIVLPLVLVLLVAKFSNPIAGSVEVGALRLLMAALLIAVLGSALQERLTADHQMVSQFLVPACCFLLTWAAARQARTAERPVTPRPVMARHSLGALSYGCIVAMDVLLLISVYEADVVSRLVVAIGVVLLSGLVVARQAAALREIVRLMRRLDYESTHDALTRLPNRALFVDRLGRALAFDGDGGSLSVALIDLDEFKSTNDTLGHATGDALLTAVAARLNDSLRPRDRLARLGGDEFAVLIEGVTPEQADTVVSRMLSALRMPLLAHGNELTISASIGVADGMSGDSADELLRRADVAMYAAKAKRCGHLHYEPGMDLEILHQARLNEELRHGIEQNQLVLHYQPLVTLPEGRIIGAEALVRWMHPERGLLSPFAFIPLAERTGLIVALGDWVMREAIRQGAQWRREIGDRAPRLNINVSPRQLRELGFAERVGALLAEAGLEPPWITVEVTETSSVTDDVSMSNLKALHEMGVRIALDDFGTGQSSLSLLHACPVDELKLDRSFAQATSTSGYNSVALAVIQLARTFGLSAVAEGAETPEQVARLYELGYPVAQGYHFGRPMAAADFRLLVPAARAVAADGEPAGDMGLAPGH